MRYRLLVHVTWITRDRLPLIDANRARFLSRFFYTVTKEEGGFLIAVGMVTTHVHLLLRLGQKTDVPRLLQRLKGASSRLAALDESTHGARPLRWAKGYNLESVSPRAVPAVVRYLESQPTQHPREVISGLPTASASGEVSDAGAGPERPDETREDAERFDPEETGSQSLEGQ